MSLDIGYNMQHGKKNSTPEVPKEEQAPKAVAPTQEQILAIKAAIVDSQTLEEVARLEQAQKTGQLPADLNIGEIDDAGKSENAREDKMVTDSEEKTNDQPGKAKSENKNDGPEEMEQE
nr:uncharacterized protein LOC113693237 [Coffea arabica]XP_027067604.1 uncharacterized protein LOC113693240 [Coffea arabica]